jgi:hypothetical protein
MVQRGKAVPEVMKSDMAAALREITQLESEVKAKQGEIAKLQERYDADKQRYRELKQVATK